MDIYVGNLPYDLEESELSDVFGAYGAVDSVKIIKDFETGRSKGFAFVVMSNDEEAQQAIDNLQGSELGGRPLKVNAAQPKEDRPRRNFDGNRGGGGGYRGGREGGGGGGYRGGREGGGGGYRGGREGGGGGYRGGREGGGGGYRGGRDGGGSGYRGGRDGGGGGYRGGEGGGYSGGGDGGGFKKRSFRDGGGDGGNRDRRSF